MGRPIKKVFIGNVSTTGSQISCYAKFPGDMSARQSSLMGQTGTGRYYAASLDGVKEGEVTLANTDSGNLLVGQATVSVDPINPAFATAYAQVIHDNTVKTWDGTHYKWYFDASHAPAGEVLAAVIEHA